MAEPKCVFNREAGWPSQSACFREAGWPSQGTTEGGRWPTEGVKLYIWQFLVCSVVRKYNKDRLHTTFVFARYASATKIVVRKHTGSPNLQVSDFPGLFKWSVQRRLVRLTDLKTIFEEKSELES